MMSCFLIIELPNSGRRDAEMCYNTKAGAIIPQFSHTLYFYCPSIDQTSSPIIKSLCEIDKMSRNS